MNQIKRFPLFTISFMAVAIIALAMPVFALDGQTGIHDPSTLMLCDGTWYTWGTGGSALESDDGWTWRAGTRCPASGAAPDVIHIGDKYFQYISHGTFLWTKSLNPDSPDYGWTVEIQRNMWGYEYDGDFINPIDTGCFLDPVTGKFWMTYGSYFGFTRVIELDPETGLRVDDKYYDVAINCEATTMIYNDGYYYLLATHGTCCQGANSEYNIRVGRSKSPTGPFVDNTGMDMMMGGGKLVLGSRGCKIGAGHFGLIDEGQDVQKFSLHWEADLDKGGASVVDVVPLVWKDGWPIAGENLTEGTYEIESVRHGTALELAVEGRAVGREAGGGGRGGMGGMMGGGRGGAGMMGGGARGNRGGAGDGAGRGARRGGAGAAVPGAGNFAGAMAPQAQGAAPGGFGGGAGAGMARGGAGMGGGMMGGRGGGGGGMFGGSGGVVADQNAADVMDSWPTGNIDARLAVYSCQAQQKWTISPAEGKGGYLGAPYFKIIIAGTDRALAASEEKELVTVPAYTGSEEQLWRIEQLKDGSYRIMPKSIPGTSEPMALSAIGFSSVTLEKFDPESDKQRWSFRQP
ncbi:MAG: family 43 glycosylhydrolase [Sedimentisphaerales bacterium]|nr:family 43 glycosylhydrolase [Sedimentisphaerales bacterium]